jgi:hypothetical protein
MQAERVTANAQRAVTAEKFPAVMGDLSVVASNKTMVDAQTAPAHRFCCGGNVEALSWRNESSLFTSIGLTR